MGFRNLGYNNITKSLNITLEDSKTKICAGSVKNVLEYILWNDLWNTYGFFGERKDKLDKHASKRYQRGQKVFVNFGHNMGREASLPHPAIIVKNFKHLAVVVPTTSKDDSDLGDLEKLLIYCPKDGNVFPEDDVVEIHQMKCISKNRIINDLGKNVRDYILPNEQIDSLNQIISDRLGTLGLKLERNMINYGSDLRKIIDIMIMFHYAPDSFEALARLQYEFENVTYELAKTKSELDSLKMMLEAASDKN